MDRDLRFFRMLADNSPLFIGMSDMNYVPFYLNEAGRKMIGLKDSEDLSKVRVQDCFFPEDQKFINEEFFPRVLREGRAETEIRFRHFVTSAPIWVIYDVFFLQGEDGEPVGLATVTLDISERKLTEEAAAEARIQTQNIIDNTPSLIYAFDLEGRFLLANKAVADLLNVTSPQLPGHKREEFMPNEDAKQHRANDEKAIEAGAAIEIEEKSHLNGRSITWLTQKFPLRDSKGRTYGSAGISTDITRLKQLKQTLRDDEARKDEFIATLAHEIRNPLASIKNTVYVLEQLDEHKEDDRQARLFAIVNRQINHLVHLVDDLLEVTRITTGKIALKRELVDLKALIHEAVEGVELQLTAQQHKLEFVLCEEPLLLQADPVRLSQVVTNILSNAIKYTPPGGKIVVSTKKHSSEVIIIIQDNGIGILPEMQAKIFDLFSQSPRTMGREQGGIGVGLSISRKLIEMHGGRIEVFSEGADRGSEFVIHLPLA